MSSSLAFNTRVRFPTSGWLIEAGFRIKLKLCLDFHVKIFVQDLVTLEWVFWFWLVNDFFFGLLTCEWNNLHFFEGKVVPPYSDQFIAFIWITITRPRNWRQFLWVSLLWSNCKFIMFTASFDFKPNTRIYELILILSRYNRGILAHFENSLDFKSTLKSTLISKDVSGTFWKQPLFQDNLNFS